RSKSIGLLASSITEMHTMSRFVSSSMCGDCGFLAKTDRTSWHRFRRASSSKFLRHHVRAAFSIALTVSATIPRISAGRPSATDLHDAARYLLTLPGLFSDVADDYTVGRQPEFITTPRLLLDSVFTEL